MEIKRLLFNRHRCNCYTVKVVLRFIITNILMSLFWTYSLFMLLCCSPLLCVHSLNKSLCS